MAEEIRTEADNFASGAQGDDGGGRQGLGVAGRRAGASPDEKHRSAAGYPGWARVAASRSPPLGSLRAGRKIDPGAKIARRIIRNAREINGLESYTQRRQGREGSEGGRSASSSPPDRQLFPLAAVSTPHSVEFTAPRLRRALLSTIPVLVPRGGERFQSGDGLPWHADGRARQSRVPPQPVPAPSLTRA